MSKWTNWTGRVSFCGWILGFKQKVSFERTTIEKEPEYKTNRSE